MVEKMRINEDSRVGTLTWDACKNCKLDNNTDCEPEIIIDYGVLFCGNFEQQEK
jgi:hypothetical protein